MKRTAIVLAVVAVLGSASASDDNLAWVYDTSGRPADAVSVQAADMSGGVSLMFGRETSGLPEDLMARYRDRSIRIPMKPRARSLNLASSAAIILYDALRQQGFPGLMEKGILAVEDDFQI